MTFEHDSYYGEGFWSRSEWHAGVAMRGAGAEQLPALVQPVLLTTAL